MNKALKYAGVDHVNTIVQQHAPLVKKIAHHMITRLPSSVLVDDLIQSGMIGLLEAARNFDGTKGASFETYASIRIRGSMVDDIRKGDWVPRSIHKNNRTIAETINILEKELGRDPKDTEIAAKLNITLSEYHSMLNDVNNGKIIGMEDLGVNEDSIVADIDQDSNEPDKQYVEQKFKIALAKCINDLPERESLVLSLYYNEELNLKQIGQVLEVSESRVSQIHSQALVRLKSKMQEWTS